MRRRSPLASFQGSPGWRNSPSSEAAARQSSLLSQPIGSLDFVASLEDLETLRANGVIYRSPFPVFAPLRALNRLTRLGVWSGNLTLDDW